MNTAILLERAAAAMPDRVAVGGRRDGLTYAGLLDRARLRSSHTPMVVEFRTELPYNATGKLLRRVLRNELGQRPANGRG